MAVSLTKGAPRYARQYPRPNGDVSPAKSLPTTDRASRRSLAQRPSGLDPGCSSRSLHWTRCHAAACQSERPDAQRCKIDSCGLED
jgi:hypothetical protein